MNDSVLIRIAVTMGDASGIGPEVIVKALADPEIAGLAQWIIIGEKTILTQAARKANLPFNPFLIKDFSNLPNTSSPVLLELEQFNAHQVVPGQLNPDCGRAALEYIRTATHLCLTQKVAAMVTAPVNKEAIVLSGVSFSGHTEFIAALCGTQESRLMLTNQNFSVVHVSTHRSLREACVLDKSRILLTIQLSHQALQLLGRKDRSIAVCGLNPHAGENGLFGDDEAKLIEPAIQAARNKGIDCYGPFPSDTAFLKAVSGHYPMVVAMYHDQGHIPMKLLAFENTVNVTLGLPIIRTSVDHGTAFDIAGKNKSDSTNIKTAMKLAIDMASRSNLRHNLQMTF